MIPSDDTSRVGIQGLYVRARDGKAFKFFGRYTSDVPSSWEAHIWFAGDKPNDVLKGARAFLSGPLLDISMSPDLRKSTARDQIERGIESCETV